MAIINDIQKRTSCYFEHQKKEMKISLRLIAATKWLAPFYSVHKGIWHSVISTVSISFGCKLVFKSFSHPILLVSNTKSDRKNENEDPKCSNIRKVSQPNRLVILYVFTSISWRSTKWNKYKIGNTQVMTCKHIHYLGHWARERCEKQERERARTRKRDSEKIKANPKLKQSCGSIKCDKETHAEVVWATTTTTSTGKSTIYSGS